MKEVLLVIVGGGMGSGLRYWIGKSVNPLFENLYLGTFLVNILGCLFIGLLFGWSLKNHSLAAPYTALLATGFCGGFTTFSAFGLELLLSVREGSYLPFFAYALLSLILGMLAVLGGIWIMRLF